MNKKKKRKLIMKNKIREFRMKRLIPSAAALGREIGVNSRSTINAWENNITQPKKEHMAALIDFFGCSYEDLFCAEVVELE